MKIDIYNTKPMVHDGVTIVFRYSRNHTYEFKTNVIIPLTNLQLQKPIRKLVNIYPNPEFSEVKMHPAFEWVNGDNYRLIIVAVYKGSDDNYGILCDKFICTANIKCGLHGKERKVYNDKN